MDAKEVIQLLRHQRHDLMNHVQILQGYLKMGKIERVEEKIQDVIESFTAERKLMNLEADQFALWLIQFNILNKNIRLTYDIHIEENLNSIDNQLVGWCQFITDSIIAYGEVDEFYEGNLLITSGEKNSEIGMTLSVNGHFKDMIQVLTNEEGLDVRQTENGIIVNRIIPLEK